MFLAHRSAVLGALLARAEQPAKGGRSSLARRVAALVVVAGLAATFLTTQPGLAAEALTTATTLGTAERAVGSPAPADWSLVPPSSVVLEVACETYIDDDHDGLDDGVERCALNDHAPLLYLPLGLDWTRPANVDWYLARSALRFHHNKCSDEEIVPIGGLTQTRLVHQYHRRKRGLASLSPCSHYGDLIASGSGPYDDDHHFFLQPRDVTHRGSTNPADWIVYGHVYPNDIGGMNVQYWFFYAYNDNVGSVNHEGDWESVTVRLNTYGNPAGVYYCAHGHCELRGDVTWFEGRHPVVWVADGSHASYTTELACDRNGYQEGITNNCQTVDAYRWFTWRGGRGSRAGLQGGGVINVGERDRPLNGQRFVRYYANWGEVGISTSFSGPRTPSYQGSWNIGAP